MNIDMKQIVLKWLGIDSLQSQIKQLQREVFDEEAMLSGFAIPKKKD